MKITDVTYITVVTDFIENDIGRIMVGCAVLCWCGVVCCFLCVYMCCCVVVWVVCGCVVLCVVLVLCVCVHVVWWCVWCGGACGVVVRVCGVW